MREIKFRALDKANKKMIYSFLLDSHGNFFSVKDPMLPTGDAYGVFDLIPGGSDIILMQFTGLLDKNGKEIYEGDIVKIPEFNRLIVQWDYDQWGLFDGPCNEASIDERVEVIGNVFDKLTKE